MKRCVLLIVIFLSITAFRPVSAACGHHGFEVKGNPEEIIVACEALDGVITYFAEAGYEIEPIVTVSFQEEVWFEFDADTGDRLKVSGYFDLHRQLIGITRWDIDPATARRPWGLEWDPSVVASILQHELVHMAATTIMGDDHIRIGGAWHELIAYAVQFELMEPAMRDRILSAHDSVAPFDSPWAINQVIYGMDPDAFGLRAYLHARERGGMTFIQEILEGELEFFTGEIFPW
jgi:hypothetical protein